MIIAILKGYKNNVPTMLLANALTENYTIKMFHNDRRNKINELATVLDRFETELRRI